MNQEKGAKNMPYAVFDSNVPVNTQIIAPKCEDRDLRI